MYNINWANQYEVMCVCLKDDNSNYGGISIMEPIISANLVCNFNYILWKLVSPELK